MSRFVKLGKCALLVKIVMSPETKAMETLNLKAMSISSGTPSGGSPRSFDDQLRDEITKYIENHKGLFLPSGIKQISEFQVELNELLDNQILFRGNNQDFKDDILYLGMDCQHLMYIS